ncbi:MAG: phosphate regulon sensor histidine kinase PhoR [Sterolibacterium sp.]|nr:phosphate regulon sensor histidine kinase PhoR [Sterolibacterium sp.]MBP9800524.1 phosphate regulon sensor histidine kinase PhoR [Sterolibacterium sp.]
MSISVVRIGFVLSTCLLLAVAVGWRLGGWAGLAVFASLLAVWLAWQLGQHMTYLVRLERWSRDPVPDVSLEAEGLWDEVFDRLYRHEKTLRQAIARREADVALFVAAGEALTDGIVTLDGEYRILWCNTTAARQLALDPQGDRGQPIVHLVRQPEFVAYLAAGAFSKPLVMTLERDRHEILALTMLPYAVGNRLLQIRDITQSVQLDRMRQDFVANVSHELRTPLTVLAGFLETVRDLPLEEEERNRYLALMMEQSERMQRIIQDLLTLSMLEAAPPPENTHIDMAALLDRLCRDAHALSSGRHPIYLEVRANLDVVGHESELLSAFGNMVSNAVRYTPPGGEIHICWQPEESGAVFSVTDSGIGIEAHHLPRLTERFYRADAGRSRASGGTGLGLAITKHALMRHQALLEITSTPGQGSRFSAHFPRHRLWQQVGTE